MAAFSHIRERSFIELGTTFYVAIYDGSLLVVIISHGSRHELDVVVNYVDFICVDRGKEGSCGIGLSATSGFDRRGPTNKIL